MIPQKQLGLQILPIVSTMAANLAAKRERTELERQLSPGESKGLGGSPQSWFLLAGDEEG